MTEVKLTPLERDVLEDIAAGNSFWQRARHRSAATGAVTRLWRKGLMTDRLWPHTSQKVTARGRKVLGIS
jgi:hypothetical protein